MKTIGVERVKNQTNQGRNPKNKNKKKTRGEGKIGCIKGGGR